MLKPNFVQEKEVSPTLPKHAQFSQKALGKRALKQQFSIKDCNKTQESAIGLEWSVGHTGTRKKLTEASYCIVLPNFLGVNKLICNKIGFLSVKHDFIYLELIQQSLTGSQS